MSGSFNRSITNYTDRNSSPLVLFSAAETLLHIVSSVSKLFRLKILEKNQLIEELLNQSQYWTSAEFSEFYTYSNEKLVPFKKEFGNSNFELSSDSLVGFVAKQEIYEIFNEPAKSALYNSFNGYTRVYSSVSNRKIEITSVCALPILNPLSKKLLGVLVLYNKLDNAGNFSYFMLGDVYVVWSIGMILCEILNLVESRKIEGEKEEKNKEIEMLEHSFKQIYKVGNTVERKQIQSKDIIEKIYANPTLPVLLKASIDIFNYTLNSEQTKILVPQNDSYLVFTDQNIENPLSCSEEKKAFYNDMKERCLTWEISENTITTFIYEGEKSIIIECENKLDDTLTNYTEFNKEDLANIETIGSKLLTAIYSLLQEKTEGINELRACLKHFASQLNTYQLLATIRSSAQKLLQCDRATVYLREGNEMVVKYQGKEQEIPVGFSLPIGKGIIGTVAQTGFTENIKDVYSDWRFNSEVDKLTGYTTRNMLCMPVFDNEKEVIAALEMINKIEESFSEEDEETLSVFSELAGCVLEDTEVFLKGLDERTRLLNILNSIGSNVLVINEKGYLEYCNKPCVDILGVTENFAKSCHYTIWLRENRKLAADISKIFEKPEEKIERASQEVFNFPFKRAMTDPKIEKKRDNFLEIFDYTIMALQEISGESAGAIMILDDASEREKLNIQFKDIKSQLLALQNPVKAETSLQKCIDRLQSVAKSMKKPGDIEKIHKVIHKLQKGNLYRAEVEIPLEFKSMESNIRNTIEEYNEESYRPKAHIWTRKLSLDYVVEESEILEKLGNWNLNFFEETDHINLIQTMLGRFELISHFEIEINTLVSFVKNVKLKYELYKNPYHNFFHALTVLHSTYSLLATTKAYESFNTYELLAILISALCHDIGHTGHTNAFEVNQQSSLAILYNDKSVLENYHSSTTFSILLEKENNILKNLPVEVMKDTRKLMIDCILATDMGKHFRAVAEMNSRFKSKDEHPLGTLEEDCTRLAGFLVHCADIAHPTKNLDEYSMWSHLICEEFSKEFFEEEERGLPLSELMRDLEVPLYYYKNEIGFLSVIVKPMWDCLNLWLIPNIDECLENLNWNIEAYKMELKKLED